MEKDSGYKDFTLDKDSNYNKALEKWSQAIEKERERQAKVAKEAEIAKKLLNSSSKKSTLSKSATL